MTAHRNTIRLVTCLLAVFLAASTLEAQIDRASVSGTVTDQSGALVAGATVTVFGPPNTSAPVVTSSACRRWK